jgi:hypothetical protein
LQVGAYAGRVDDDGDVEFGELGFGANAAEFEQLRSVERAAEMMTSFLAYAALGIPGSLAL